MAFIAPIIAWAGSAAGTAVISAAAVAGSAVYSASASKKAAKKAAGGAFGNVPAAPDPSKLREDASSRIRKKKRSTSKSIFTSPLGISGQADIARAGLKTKLGQ